MCSWGRGGGRLAAQGKRQLSAPAPSSGPGNQRGLDSGPQDKLDAGVLVKGQRASGIRGVGPHKAEAVAVGDGSGRDYNCMLEGLRYQVIYNSGAG